MITTAYINIWNKRVGAIAWDDSNGLASFEYETSFLEVFEGAPSLSIDIKRQLAKSMLELISKENYCSAIKLSKTLYSKKTQDETIRELFATYFEFTSSDLFTSKILE